MYDEKTITGYLAIGMDYDFSTQKKYVEQIGIENYLSEFNDWFKANTDGYCAKK